MFRGRVLFLCLATVHSRAAAQVPVALDTAIRYDTACHARILPYWCCSGKYPERSDRLVILANEALKGTAGGNLSGYITFRFLITCNGAATGFRLQQMDPHYQAMRFPEALVNGLFTFIKSLRAWPAAVYKGEPIYYNTYLSFKIRNGHVVEVAP